MLWGRSGSREAHNRAKRKYCIELHDDSVSKQWRPDLTARVWLSNPATTAPSLKLLEMSIEASLRHASSRYGMPHEP